MMLMGKQKSIRKSHVEDVQGCSETIDEWLLKIMIIYQFYDWYQS